MNTVQLNLKPPISPAAQIHIAFILEKVKDEIKEQFIGYEMKTRLQAISMVEDELNLYFEPEKHDPKAYHNENHSQ